MEDRVRWCRTRRMAMCVHVLVASVVVTVKWTSECVNQIRVSIKVRPHSEVFSVQSKMVLVIGHCGVRWNGSFVCQCVTGWDGRRCEKRSDFCQNQTCEHGGVCRSLLLDYRCECLGDSYSGRQCEIEAAKTKRLQMVALSVAYVAIIFISSTGLFIVSLDLLKYWFHVDLMRPVKKQQTKVKNKRGKRVIMHHVYVNSPTNS